MRRLLTSFALGFVFQSRAMSRSVDTYFTLVGTPFTTAVLMSMVLYSGRSDLAAYAVVAPTLMSLWTAALMFSGEMISDDRENGRLEPLVASPVSLPSLVFGRLCGAMLISLPAFALAVAVAGLGFGVVVAGPAFAGEVNGNGDPTGAPANSNSICSYSGQNDGNPPGGRVQSYGQNVKAGRDDPHVFNPGDVCQGGSNPRNP